MQKHFTWALLLLFPAISACNTDMPPDTQRRDAASVVDASARDAFSTTDARTQSDASSTSDATSMDAATSDSGLANDAASAFDAASVADATDARRRRDASIDANADASSPACTVANETSESPSAPLAWTFHRLDTATYPTAVCNDGTPGAYLLRRNPSSNRWLIYLKGGGYCAVGSECNDRWTHRNDLMTTTDDVDEWRSDVFARGMFGTDPLTNPTWNRANIVIVSYCSSDTWGGDRMGNPSLPPTNVRRWHFRGRAIVDSVITELLGMGLSTARDVTLAGGSAGGGGVFSNADDVAARLPSSVRFLAVSDAGYQLSQAAYGAPPGSPSPYDTLLPIADATWGGRGDRSCYESVDVELRPWCRMGPYLLANNHIETTMMAVVSQMDFNQTVRLRVTTVDQDSCVVSNPDQATYVRDFATSMRSLSETIAPQHSTFIDYTCHHVLVQGPDTPPYAIDGVNLSEALAAFHARPCEVQRRIEAPFGSAP